MDQRISQRLEELIQFGERVKQTKFERFYGGMRVAGDLGVNPELAQQLGTSCLSNKLTQKRITALADIRNKAAHGEWDEFTKADVEDMLRGVRRFMEAHFS